MSRLDDLDAPCQSQFVANFSIAGIYSYLKSQAGTWVCDGGNINGHIAFSRAGWQASRQHDSRAIERHVASSSSDHGNGASCYALSYTQTGFGQSDGVARCRVSASKSNAGDNVLVGVVGKGDYVASSDHTSACGCQRNYGLTNGKRCGSAGGGRHRASSAGVDLCGFAQLHTGGRQEHALTHDARIVGHRVVALQAKEFSASRGVHYQMVVAQRCAVVLQDFQSIGCISEVSSSTKRSGCGSTSGTAEVNLQCRSEEH